MSAPTPKEEPAPAEATTERVVQPASAAVITHKPSEQRAMTNLEFLPEMSPFPASLTGAAPSLTLQEQAAFASAWREVAPDVESGVTSAKLVDISRWAAQQTASATLERGWASSMVMHPIGASSDGRRVLMGQTAEESKVALPSHNTVVFRRLLVAAEFDRDSGRIGRVLVTIRGWAEE